MVIGRPLVNGAYAILFLNNDPIGSASSKLTCDQHCLGALGIKASEEFTLRDLWQHEDIGKASLSSPIAATVEAGGASMVFKLTPV